MAKTRRLDRVRVIAVAADLADERGLEALTLAALAKELNIRIPSLYNHIDGLAALRREIGLLGLRDLEPQLARAAAGRQGTKALRAVAHAYTLYANTHPGRYLAAQRPASASDPELARAGAAVVELLRAILKSIGLNARDQIHAVRGFRALIHGFVSLQAAGGFGLPVEVEQSLDRALSWFFEGLVPQNRQRPRPNKYRLAIRPKRP